MSGIPADAKRRWGAALLSVALALSSAVLAEEVEDVTEPKAVVIPLTAEKSALDVKAPPSQFVPEEGAKLWDEAKQRASTALPEQGTGFFDVADRMPEEFRLARNFQSEDYTVGELASEMRMAITANQAERKNKFLLLTGMKLTVFIGKSMLDKPGGNKKKSPKGVAELLAPKPPETPSADKSKKHGGSGKGSGADANGNPAGLMDVLPIGGRVIISAPNASINIDTNEGHATGHVTIEVFPKREAGKPYQPIAVLETEHLNWRSWSEPSIGTAELAAYTCGAGNDDPDPVVRGQFNLPQPDGSTATTLIEGHGLIFEVGMFDRPDQIFDEDGRLAGLNKTAHNRALFHKNNKMITTATSMKGLIPFQGNAPVAPAATPKNQKKKPAEEPYRTEITCEGPALLDMGAVPRQKPPENAGHTQILLCKRFMFLDKVNMRKIAVDPKTGEPVDSPTATKSNMACGALVLQYPPGVMPGPTTFPDYAEAINGVQMDGTTMSKPTPEQPTPLPVPFNIQSQRVFLDGPGDNTFLVGTQKQPVQIKHDRVETLAQQFNFRSRSQTLVMPSEGPKRMIIHAPAQAGATTPAPNGAGINMSTGDTVLNWTGTLTREVKVLPVPHKADRQEEVLTVKQDVVIEKPESGLRMRGDTIHIIRTEPEEDVIFIDGKGNTEVMTPDMRATGDSFNVDMAFEPEKADPAKPNEIPRRQAVTMTGNAREKIKATAYMGGTAVRTEKFVSDQIANTFHAFGGSVIVVKPPPDPNAAAAKAGNGALVLPKKDPKAAGGAPAPAAGAPMVKGVTFEPGATTFMQCDGDFTLNADHTGILERNVIVKQPGMQILADQMFLVMSVPAEDPNAPKPPDGAPTKSGSLASGDLKSIDCQGNVEVMTDDQVIQCDRLFHEVEHDTSVMTMTDPESDVRIYRPHDETGKSEVVTVLKSLDYDGKSGTFKPGGRLLILPYRKEVSAARDKESSPAWRKGDAKK